MQRRSIDFQHYFRDLYRSRYSRLNDVYVYENLRIVMANNFSFRTNIQFPTSRYVVHYTWRLYNSRLIGGLSHEKCAPFEPNDFQDVVRAFLALTLVETYLKGAFRFCGETTMRCFSAIYSLFNILCSRLRYINYV